MSEKLEMQQLSPKVSEKINERISKLKDRIEEYSLKK